MGLIVFVERVVDALFKDLIWILWPTRALWSRFRVRETEITEEFSEVTRMIFDIELLLDEVPNLL